MQSLAILLPPRQGASTALLAQSGKSCKSKMSLVAHQGKAGLWPDYLKLCRTNKEPLLRKIRLSPCPVALSDIIDHPGLEQRSAPLREVLGEYGMNDAFVVPLFDQELNLSTLVVAGRDLPLRPTYRYLLSQAAAETHARITSLTALASNARRKPHHELTPRQMEIAAWLVAGKTDWEIGEILQISPKTVNFHVENIKRTYGVRSRNQFVAAIVHDGGLHPD